MELGVITRTHALPTLYYQFEDIRGDKELALLNSGSECNMITLTLAIKYGLSIQSIEVVSKGLHQSKPFVGEVFGKIILAGNAITEHFFVLDGDTGEYDILLGMSFLRDTSLTFDYNDGRLVTANYIIGNKLIKAHVVSDAISGPRRSK